MTRLRAAWRQLVGDYRWARSDLLEQAWQSYYDDMHDYLDVAAVDPEEAWRVARAWHGSGAEARSRVMRELAILLAPVVAAPLAVIDWTTRRCS